MNEAPWDRNAGKFERPSSGVPAPAERAGLEPDVWPSPAVERAAERVEAELVVDGMGSADLLRAFVERCERLDEEIAGLRHDRKDVMAEAKGAGFDTKTLTAVIRRRRIEPHLRREADALLETYETALGMSSPGMVDGGELVVRVALPDAAPKLTRRTGSMQKALALGQAAQFARTV